MNRACFYPSVGTAAPQPVCLLFHFIHPSHLPLRCSLTALSLCPPCLCYRAYLELLGRLAKQVSLAGRCSEKKKKKNPKYVPSTDPLTVCCFALLVVTFTATQHTLQFALGGFSCLTFSILKLING